MRDHSTKWVKNCFGAWEYAQSPYSAVRRITKTLSGEFQARFGIHVVGWFGSFEEAERAIDERGALFHMEAALASEAER